MNNPQVIGVLLVGIGSSPFSEIFNNQQVDFNTQVLISQNDTIIFQYCPVNDSFLSSLTPDENKILIHSDGIINLSKKVYVRHITNVLQTAITSVVPYKEFRAEIRQANLLIFSLAAGCFAVGVLLMCIFSNGITRTLKN